MHQDEPSDKAHGLVRELGLKEGIAIGLGTMIGAGIFVLAAIAAERAGPAAALSYIFAGTLCLLIALVVGTLVTIVWPAIVKWAPPFDASMFADILTWALTLIATAVFGWNFRAIK